MWYAKSIVKIDISYVDQMKRLLKIQRHIKEHRNHINKNTTQRSVVIGHKIEHNHDFYWNNIKILDK